MTTKNIFNKLILLLIMLCFFIVISCKSPNNPTTNKEDNDPPILFSKKIGEYNKSGNPIVPNTKRKDTTLSETDIIIEKDAKIHFSAEKDPYDYMTIEILNNKVYIKWNERNQSQTYDYGFYEVVFYNSGTYQFPLETGKTPVIPGFSNTSFDIPSYKCNDYKTDLEGVGEKGASVYIYFRIGSDLSYDLFRVK